MKKPKKVKRWWLINAALTLVGRKQLGILTKASKDGKKTLAKTLRDMLTTSKDTAYGKEHHFNEIISAKTPEEMFALYQKYVPVNEYEALYDYVERHKNGETDVLIPGKPKMYCTTSGTTRDPKWIPVSERYYQEVVKTMNQVWFYAMLRSRPKMYQGHSLSIVGKAIEGAAPDGTICGSISGVIQRDVLFFVRETYSTPHEAFYIDDYKARYYALFLMGLEKSIGALVTPNPSTIVEMINNINEYYDDYCNDIEHGTISEKFNIPAEIRAALLKNFKAKPERAEELRKLKTRHGTVLPKHYWPHMQICTCWFSGNTRVYFERIRDAFPPDCLFHEMGYISTECKVGVTLKTNSKETTIFGHKNYVEFIHESEMDSPNPKIYQAYEVEEDQRYLMLVTTLSGLYRYNTNDLVKITSFHNEFPNIEFVEKVNGITSLTGEKLHEQQFVEAVKETEKRTGKIAPFFVGFADPVKSRYKFYFEFADQDISVTEAEEFTSYLDDCLQKFNSEYKEKRASNRLKEPETALLGPKAFERFKETCVINHGFRDGQFKVNLLMQDEKRHALFKELVKK